MFFLKHIFYLRVNCSAHAVMYMHDSFWPRLRDQAIDQLLGPDIQADANWLCINAVRGVMPNFYQLRLWPTQCTLRAAGFSVAASFVVCGTIENGGKTPIDPIVQSVALVCISGKQHDRYLMSSLTPFKNVQEVPQLQEISKALFIFTG